MNRLKLLVNEVRMEKPRTSNILPNMKNEVSRLKIFLVFVFFAITKLALSQSIYTNPITGTNPSNNAPYTTGQTVATGITVSGLNLSGGVNAANATDRFSADGWSQNATIATGDYFSWTITPGSCYDLDFTSLVIAYQRSGNGPPNLALRSSADNYAANIWTVSAIPTAEQTSTISLSAAAFQNLTTAITFRIYGWGGTGNGTFSINSFTFNGAVTSTNTAVAGNITGSSSVCSGSNTTLTVSGHTGNIQWQTSTDNITFTNITGATSATYTTPNITATRYYRAGSTVGTCPTIYSSSFTVSITAPSMTAVNGSGCAPAAVNLAVNAVCQPAGSTTNWYAAATGGSSLGTGSTFTTPALNSTTTYYANSTFSAGAALSTGDRSATNQRGLRFNALAPFVLNSVQINTNGAGSITLELRDNLNQPVAALVYTATAGTNTVPLGWTIPAGTGYRIIKTAGTIELSRTDPFAFPVGTAGVLSITSSENNGAVENGRYFYFYNWNVSTARIPVVATINATNSDVTTSACGTYTWAANGVTYNTSGVYYFVGPCNTATLNLTITPNTGSSTTASACGSYTWSENGQTYTASGTYTSVTGCNTETLVLTITPNTTPTTTITACDSYTWSVNGQTYTTSGTYTSVSGCATNTLVLTINSSSSSTSSLTTCAPYVWPVNGQSYSASGTYTSVNGCQTENIVLTISTPSVTAVGDTACAPAAVNLAVSQVCQPVGSTTNWYAASTGGASLGTGNNYTTPVLNATTTYYTSNNYIAGATLSTGNRSTTNQRGLIFNAVVPILLNSVQINTNNAGSITLELRDNLNQPVAGAVAVVFNAAAGTNTVPLGWTIPAGTGYRIIKTAGTPQLSRTDPFTFPISVNGILSITSAVDAGAVENTRYFYFYNWNVSTPRIPVVATINTPIVPTFTQVAGICSGETLNALPTTSNNSITGTWSPALDNTATTTYTFTPTAGQCASTATMTITVNPELTAGVSIAASATTICDGTSVTFTATPTNGGTSPSYVWKKNGTSISGANASTYSTTSLVNGDVITCVMTSNATPCLIVSEATSNDVTMVVNPIVNPTFTQVSAICSGSSLIALPTTSNNGITGTWAPALNNTATTTYTFTPTAGQCASTATMTITVNPLTNNTTTASACDSYTWSENGITYTTSGTYTSVTGCHTETLVLTITPSTSNTTTASACDSYTWSANGTTYTTSGTYTSVIGCNTETLVLTITPSTNDTTTASACDSYTWSENGTTYTASGTYTSVTGCHTETLVLTITPNTNNTTTASACDSYTWSVNGNIYTASGTYTSVTGCHTETLVITITPSTSNMTTASACDSYTWSVNGTTYNASGTYISVAGCQTDSLVLTINTSTVYYVDADGDGFGSTTTANLCSLPSSGYSLNNTDCDDAVGAVYPGATELCNGVDDNCSGFIDEGCPSTIAGEEPFNSILAPSGMYSYCSSFYGTLAGAFPSANANSSCVTGEDVWYNFVAQSSGTTIFIGSYVNDIVIELQDANGNLVEVENTVNGPGTEVLTTTNLIAGQEYRIGIRNNNGILNPGGAFSACVRHLRRGGADSGTSATWPSTLSTCSLFKASYCGGTGVQYRYTWTGISGTATGQVFTRTQTSDYLNVTAVTPSLHAGSMYNVLVTAIYTIPNGAGVNEVVELTALAPSTITISPVANVALRSADQLSNGPRYRGSIVAALPWVCGVTNWRWRFTEVNPLTLQTVGLPIEQNRAAASNYINLNSVTALQYGKTYAVQSAPLFSYTGSNYQWGPVTYMAIIGSAGLIVDPSEGSSQGSEKDVLQDSSKGLPQDLELNVFPNPSNGSDLNLNISGIESDNVLVKIYDSMGRKVESLRLVVNGNLQTQLPMMNNYSNGMYMIEVTSELQTKSSRVLISK